MKAAMFILFAVALIFGQTSTAYNVKITNMAINTFAADSAKVTSWVPIGDGEGVDVVIKSTALDSSVFQVGYQRGYWDGGRIVPKRPFWAVDTFNTLTAGNYQVLGSSVASVNDTDKQQAIDTVGQGGMVVMARHIPAYFRSPYARVVCKGLTGNKNTNYSLFITVSQPKYVRVDVGSGRQPE